MQKKIQRLQIQVRSLKIHNASLREKLKTGFKRGCGEGNKMDSNTDNESEKKIKELMRPAKNTACLIH
jgi:hypothetical protein